MDYGRTAYYLQAVVAGVHPIAGAILSARDKVTYMDDYMNNRGLSYSDIKYPTMTMGFNGVQSLTSNSVQFVSHNLMRLYG